MAETVNFEAFDSVPAILEASRAGKIIQCGWVLPHERTPAQNKIDARVQAELPRFTIRGRFAADIVALLAIVTAAIMGEAFAGVIVVLMQSGGEALERYGLRRASSALDRLLARAPRVAYRKADGALEEIDVRAYALRPRGLHLTEDFRESARAFVEKRKPVYKGR